MRVRIPWGWLVLWLAPPVAVVMAVAVAWSMTSRAEDPEVEFRIGGTPVATVPLSEALRRAEAELGYGLVRPRDLPDGYRLDYVDAAWIDDPVRLARFPRAFFGYADTSGGATPLLITEGNEPVGPRIRLVAFDAAIDDVEIDTGWGYGQTLYWTVEGSGPPYFHIRFAGEHPAPEDKVRRLLQALHRR
jgi:hypothetical protein